MPQLFDRGRVEAISLIVLGRSAGGEIAVAFALVFTQGADALHVVQHQWFDAREIVAVDAEGVEQFRQFIRSMRPETNQFIQIGGGNRKSAAMRSNSDVLSWRI